MKTSKSGRIMSQRSRNYNFLQPLRRRPALADHRPWQPLTRRCKNQRQPTLIGLSKNAIGFIHHQILKICH